MAEPQSSKARYAIGEIRAGDAPAPREGRFRGHEGPLLPCHRTRKYSPLEIPPRPPESWSRTERRPRREHKWLQRTWIAHELRPPPKPRREGDRRPARRRRIVPTKNRQHFVAGTVSGCLRAALSVTGRHRGTDLERERRSEPDLLLDRLSLRDQVVVGRPAHALGLGRKGREQPAACPAQAVAGAVGLRSSGPLPSSARRRSAPWRRCGRPADGQRRPQRGQKNQ